MTHKKFGKQFSGLARAARNLVGLLLCWSAGSALAMPPPPPVNLIVPIAIDDLFILVPSPFALPTNANWIEADLNGDGYKDLFVQAVDANGTNYIFFGNSRGEYQTRGQSWKNGQSGIDWSADKVNIFITDFNGDGRGDFIVEQKVNGGRVDLLLTNSQNGIDSVYQTWYETPISAASTQTATTNVVGATAGSLAVSPSGAAIYSVPIVVPPGFNGMQPNLALSYNSQAGNSTAGIGWSISGISGISRCGATIDRDGYKGGVTLDSSDKFCLDGQRLLAISGASGTEYRTESETFSKIVPFGTQGTGPSYFKVYSRSGQIMEYGNGNGSQQYAKGNDTVLAWNISSTQDAIGNSVGYYYNTDSYSTGEHHIDHIDYTLKNGVAIGGLTRSVKFNYSTGRGDVEVRFVAGVTSSGDGRVEVSKRLDNIKTMIGTAAVRTYTLTYELNGNFVTKRSQLSRIKECGADGVCLEPTVFSWAGTAAPEFKKDWSYGHGVGDSGWQLSDLFGDGTQVYYTHNKDGTHYATRLGRDGTVKNWTWTGGHGVGDSGWQLADLFGDGQQVYYTHNKDGTHYATRLNADGTYKNWTWSGGHGVEDGGWRLVDLFGDGRKVYYTHSSAGMHYATRLNPDQTVEKFSWSGGHGLGDAGWEMADLFGDGRQVYYTHSSNGTHYATRLNADGTLKNWTWTSGHGVGNAGWRLADLFGDGHKIYYTHSNDGTHYATRLNLDQTVQNWTWTGGYGVGDAGWDIADLFSDGRQVYYTHNNAGTHYATRLNANNTIDNWTWTNGHGVGNAGWQLGDPFGDGWLSYYTHNSNGTHSVTRLLYEKPDMLSTVTTAMDVWTTIKYKPLTDGAVYTRGANAVYPVVDSQPALYAVSSVAISDGVAGNSTTSYTYAGLKNHQTGRGSLGFQSMTTVAPNGLQTFNFYLQNFPYIGWPWVTRVSKASDPTFVISDQRTDPNCLYGTGVNLTSDTVSCKTDWPKLTGYGETRNIGSARYYAYPYVSTTYSNDVDPARTELPFKMSVNTGVDSYGNVGRVSATTGPANVASQQFSTNTYNYFVNDTANWRLGQLVATQVLSTIPANDSSTNASQNQTRTALSKYDAYGRLVRTVVEPEAGSFDLASGNYSEPATASPPYYTLITEYTYDPTYGYNDSVTVRGKDVATRTTRTAYVNGTTPGSLNPQIQTKNALGHVDVQTLDAKFGVTTNMTGPNGLSTQWAYDGFGRKVGEKRPDGTYSWTTLTKCGGSGCYLSAELPLARYSSETGVYTAAGTKMAASVWVYYDRLGRQIRTETLGFSNEIVEKDTRYDALGRVYKSTRDYFSSQSAPWTIFGYDLIGRTISVKTPDGAETKTDYLALSMTINAPASDDGLIRKRTEVRNSAGQLVSVKERNKGNDAYTTITYKYDALGNLAKVVTEGVSLAGGIKSSTITNAFDIRGRKIAMNDPDMGAWTYGYDVLGQLVSQTDAKNQTTGIKYDVLGRMIRREEAEGASTWEFDTAPYGKGKVYKVTGPMNKSGRVHWYDNLGRPSLVGTTIDGELYTMGVGYDSATGRITNVRFPSTVPGVDRFGFYNNYSANGFLEAVSSQPNKGGTVYWKADVGGIDASGHVVSETLGNGTQTKRAYNPITDLLSDIDTTAPGSAIVQDDNHTYYTGVPNLKTRSSYLAGISYTESFTYDELNRVLTANTTTGAVKSFVYDGLGNIGSKTGVGTYAYDGPRPHAVSSVTGTVNGVVNPSYSYDANGNLYAGAGRTLTYTSFNMPRTVTAGGITQTYGYDAEHQRTVMTDGASRTVYLNPRLDIGTHFEKETKGSVDNYKHYIYAGGKAVALYTISRDNAANFTKSFTSYLHTDHLGSIEAITDQAGVIVQRFSYDAWGKRRNTNGTDTSLSLTSDITDHGYTGHEMVDVFGLINMNGRWYDPMLGRFMQADPTIDGARDAQGYNRYSYVHNNPLSYTDPSGYKKFWERDNWVNIRGGIKLVVGGALFAAAWIPGPWSYPVGMAGLWMIGSGLKDLGITDQVLNKAQERGVGGSVEFGSGGPSTSTRSGPATGGAGGSGGSGGSSGGTTSPANITMSGGVAYDQFGRVVDLSNVVADGSGKMWGGRKPYPNSLDPLIETEVQRYNTGAGLVVGNPEYLDSALVKAMVRVESGFNARAYENDPMQVNVGGDWAPEKAKFGLVRGQAPGAELGIRSGIGWLTGVKAYSHDSTGRAVQFRGWPKAVERYNGGGDPGYLDKVMTQYEALK